MRGYTNRLWVRLSLVIRLSLRVCKVLLLVHGSRCDCRAAIGTVRGVVLHALRRESRGNAPTSHRLVGHRAIGLRRVVRNVRIVMGLRLETTATTTIWWKAPLTV